MNPSTLSVSNPVERVTGILQAVFNLGALAAVEEAFTPDVVLHDPGLELHGPERLRAGVASLRTAFPDFCFSVVDAFAAADRVAIRYRGTGTHRAEFLGLAATGRRIDYSGILIVRLANERIAEVWAQPDQLGILKQLGATLH